VPLPALRRAWAQLGQPRDPDAGAADASTWLQAAAARFDPARIPRTDHRHTDCIDRA
jgi:hypothetical protein